MRFFRVPNAVYGIVFPFGFSYGGSGGSLTLLSTYTPGLWGVNPNIFQGTALYMAGSGHTGWGGRPSKLCKYLPRIGKYFPTINSGVGFGYGGTALLMGRGVSLSDGPIFGHDTGVDILTGICIKIWSS